MKKQKLLSLLLVSAMAVTALTGCGSSSDTSTAQPPQQTTDNDGETADATAAGDTTSSASAEEMYAGEEPLKITMYYSDNATLPFQEDWLTVQTIQDKYNVDISWEIIPIADYSTKVSVALNTGTNAPDVVLYQTTAGENGSLALNGALVPISDYADWTPNFNERVAEFGLQDKVESLSLEDGKRYYMPSLTDKPFYDGGLILRQDFLDANGFEAPKTYDDLYNILKAYKEENPSSYPLTILAGPRVLYRMTMPAFGVSVGKKSCIGNECAQLGL